MRLFLFSIFSILMLNCSNIKKDNQNDKYLEVFYIKEGLHFPMQLGCNVVHGELLKDKVKFKKIDDVDFMNQFINQFKQLKTSKEQRDIDVRIQVVYHNKKAVDTICMGEHFDIKVNGMNKENSKTFLKLIKDETYYKKE